MGLFWPWGSFWSGKKKIAWNRSKGIWRLTCIGLDRGKQSQPLSCLEGVAWSFSRPPSYFLFMLILLHAPIEKYVVFDYWGEKSYSLHFSFFFFFFRFFFSIIIKKEKKRMNLIWSVDRPCLLRQGFFPSCLSKILHDTST